MSKTKSGREGLDGVLPVDKPEGPTSHDIVDKARRSLGLRRVGHTGTLDPFASGLLLLCVGRATRLVPFFHGLPKLYEARLSLGVETDTDDRTGSELRRSDAWTGLSRGQLAEALAGLQGEQSQVPPAYSAKRVGGRRAYSVARSGEPVPLPATLVRVHRLTLLQFQPPQVDIELEVSTGTYVRALARDLGRALGCYAHVSGLRRTAIGPFEADQSLPAGELADSGQALAALWDPARAVSWMPRRELSIEEARRVSHGGAVEVGDVRPPPPPGAGNGSGARVALLAGGRLAAIARLDGDRLRPIRVFHAT
jgi:tRNA pseudouridine55 synthase